MCISVSIRTSKSPRPYLLLPAVADQLRVDEVGADDAPNDIDAVGGEAAPLDWEVVDQRVRRPAG